MTGEHTTGEKDDCLAPDVTLERLTDVLNEVLAIPAQEGLGLVIRAQVERASAAPAETDAPEDRDDDAGPERAPVDAKPDANDAS
jgi:hypothetical protein